MVPVVLVKHRKDEVFLVRFLSDNNEMNVDLGATRFRFKEVCSGVEAQSLTGDGNGVAKRGRKKKEDALETGKAKADCAEKKADSAEKKGRAGKTVRQEANEEEHEEEGVGKGERCDKGGGEVEKKKKKRKSKGKMWDELMEEDDKKNVPQMSREERKALAVWQRIVDMEKQASILKSSPFSEFYRVNILGH